MSIRRTKPPPAVSGVIVIASSTLAFMDDTINMYIIPDYTQIVLSVEHIHVQNLNEYYILSLIYRSFLCGDMYGVPSKLY